MPMIKKEFECTEALRLKIKAFEEDEAFDHRRWNDPELEDIRCAIRDFYKYQQLGFCAYCRNPISMYSAGNCHVEHILPKSIYQNFIFKGKNLCVICADCNTIKRNQEVLNEIPNTIAGKSERKRYPTTSKAFKIIHPHFDLWDDHIIKISNIYIDRTPKGGFTIFACRLNRYYHKFGWDEALIDSQNLSELANAYLDAPPGAQQSALLSRLSVELEKPEEA